MPSQRRTNALRGVAPRQCPRCGRETTEKDYRYSPTGACRRQCRKCDKRKELAAAAERKRIRQARTAYAIWQKVIRI